MKDFLNVVNDWLPSIGVIISAILSFLIAKSKSKSEIKKILLNFNREDQLAATKAYTEFMSATSDYCGFKSDGNRNKAVKATALYMSYAPSSIFVLLQEMDKALSKKDASSVDRIRNEILNLYPTKMQYTN